MSLFLFFFLFFLFLTSKLHYPFPNKAWFLRVCSTSLLKTLWEKEKLPVTSNFSFSHSVFYLFGELSAIFKKLEIVVCKLFQFGKLAVWERVKWTMFYLNCLYESIKSSYKASFCVEIAFGQNVLLCNFIWPKCPWPKHLGQNICGQNVFWPKCPGQNVCGQNVCGQNICGQNVCGQNVLAKTSVAKTSVAKTSVAKTSVAKTSVAKTSVAKTSNLRKRLFLSYELICCFLSFSQIFRCQQYKSFEKHCGKMRNCS